MTNTDAKLKRATSEFESMLLSSWLEKMQESYGLDEKAESMPGSESMTALATQAVASAMAQRGGIGIGRMMFEKLKGRELGPGDPEQKIG